VFVDFHDNSASFLPFLRSSIDKTVLCLDNCFSVMYGNFDIDSLYNYCIYYQFSLLFSECYE
jgi:hypothetical protein